MSCSARPTGLGMRRLTSPRSTARTVSASTAVSPTDIRGSRSMLPATSMVMASATSSSPRVTTTTGTATAARPMSCSARQTGARRRPSGWPVSTARTASACRATTTLPIRSQTHGEQATSTATDSMTWSSDRRSTAVTADTARAPHTSCSARPIGAQRPYWGSWGWPPRTASAFKGPRPMTMRECLSTAPEMSMATGSTTSLSALPDRRSWRPPAGLGRPLLGRPRARPTSFSAVTSPQSSPSKATTAAIRSTVPPEMTSSSPVPATIRCRAWAATTSSTAAPVQTL